MKIQALVLALASALTSLPVLAEEISKPLPVSAHNCYPANSTSNDRLVEALAPGSTTSRSTWAGMRRITG